MQETSPPISQHHAAKSAQDKYGGLLDNICGKSMCTITENNTIILHNG